MGELEKNAHTEDQRRHTAGRGMKRILAFTLGWLMNIFLHPEPVCKDWERRLSFQMSNFQQKIMMHTKN